MADKKISELDAITGSATAATDVFVVVDTSTGQTKKITREELNNAIEQDVLSTIDIENIEGDFSVNGNMDITGTVDGRDVSVDGTKLDGIEASATADQTGAEIASAISNETVATLTITNLTAGGLSYPTSDGTNGQVLKTDGSGNISFTTVSGGGAVDSVNTQTGTVVLDADDISDTSTTNKYTTAGDISKLAGIEALADVTDATNVTAAGAAMLTGATFTGNVSFGDNNKAIFGAGSDLEIYHDGTDSFIDEKASGWLYIRANDMVLGKYTGETYVKGIADGAVELYHNNSKKIETTSTGADVAGEFIATSFNETYDALSGTTPTVDCHNGNMFSLTTSGNTTFTFSNPPASGTAFGFTLKLVAGGTHTITYPAAVDWAGGSAPDAPASGETDVLVFITHDGGTTWYGFRSGDAMA